MCLADPLNQTRTRLGSLRMLSLSHHNRRLGQRRHYLKTLYVSFLSMRWVPVKFTTDPQDSWRNDVSRNTSSLDYKKHSMKIKEAPELPQILPAGWEKHSAANLCYFSWKRNDDLQGRTKGPEGINKSPGGRTECHKGLFRGPEN